MAEFSAWLCHYGTLTLISLHYCSNSYYIMYLWKSNSHDNSAIQRKVHSVREVIKFMQWNHNALFSHFPQGRLYSTPSVHSSCFYI